MKRLLSTLAAFGLTVSAVSPVQAQTYANTYERDCREQLNLLNVELQPGLTKEKLRDCIRAAATLQRQQDAEARNGTTIEERRQQRTLDRVLEEQQVVIPVEGITSSAKRTQFEQECRESMDLGRNQVIQPGPVKGALERCIERKTSEAKREADLRRRRDSVRQRQDQLGTSVLDRQTQKIQEALQIRSDAARKRIQDQTTIEVPNANSMSRPTRALPYYQSERIDNEATRRQDAQNCRGVPAREWGDCIRNALNPDTE